MVGSAIVRQLLQGGLSPQNSQRARPDKPSCRQSLFRFRKTHTPWRNLRHPQNPRGLANISQGLERCLYMGNIDALRDWGHAKDYVHMQWLMLQQDHAEDFVIATGVQYSVRQFVEWSAAALGMQLRWDPGFDS